MNRTIHPSQDRSRESAAFEEERSLISREEVLANGGLQTGVLAPSRTTGTGAARQHLAAVGT